MEVIYVLLPVALALAGAALWGYFRALKSGQFDDLETPPMRVLHEDEPVTGTGTGERKPDAAAAGEGPAR